MNWIDDFLVSRKRKRMSREDSLAARPVRNPSVEWKLVDGKSGEEALLSVPPPKSSWMPVLRVLLVVPTKSRQIQLDELGTFVWTRCDGLASVNVLCDELCARYRLSFREGLVSLTTYLRQLGRRGLVAFAVERADEPGTPEREKEAPPASAKTQEPASAPAKD